MRRGIRIRSRRPRPLRERRGRRRAARRNERARTRGSRCRRTSRPSAARTRRRHRSDPSSGAVTSLSRRMPPAGARTQGVALEAGRARRAPLRHRGSGAPSASSRPSPRAASAPAPPSVEAEPPSPITRRSAPASRAAAMTSPSPRVVAPERVGRRHQRQPGCLGEFHDGGPVGEFQPAALDRPAIGAGDGSRRPDARSGHRGGDRVERSLASVGLGEEGQAIVRTDREPAARRWPQRQRAASSEPLNESGAMTTVRGTRPGYRRGGGGPGNGCAAATEPAAGTPVSGGLEMRTGPPWSPHPHLVPPTRFERATSSSGGKRSIH